VTEALHEKYVPILQFARGERFFPMAVDDFLRYSVLRQRGVERPLVRERRITPGLLRRAYEGRLDVFVQSVPSSLADQNVAAMWSRDVLESVVDLSYRTSRWQQGLARVAYSWFSAKTAPATQLFWWNNLVMSLLGQGKQSSQDLPRLNLPPEIRQAALANYERSQTQGPGYTYYYRTTRDAEYLCLQYWFFYGYNDWATTFGGMNDHEGDWEGLYLFFELDPAGRPTEPPAYVTFVGHHSRLTKPWVHRDVTREGNHPVAYVAAGSHATYPERKRYEIMKIYGLVDDATGDGLAIQPSDWRPGVDLDAAPWASAFLGGWGTRYWLPVEWAKGALGSLRSKVDEFGLPGVSAPRGPRYSDDGSERPNWTRAVDWAGVFDLEKN
jgi:hypothetical protein